VEPDAFWSNRLGRHCEQSEAIQTWGLRRRLSLDRFAVARDDGGAWFNQKGARSRLRRHLAAAAVED
jgi:hypothetical protein